MMQTQETTHTFDMETNTIYYLEMLSKDALNPKEGPKGLVIAECKVKQYQYNAFLYRLVGGDWEWIDKLPWTDSQWKSYVEQDNLRTWVAYEEGSIAGYYELLRQPGGNVEIIYFGITGPFIGKGLGGYLLTHAIRSAWAWEGTRRVWVHTCTKDHPGALSNYKARGMTLYKQDVMSIPEYP